MPSSATALTEIYTLSLHDALPIWIDIFAVGSDGAMHHRPWDNGGWLRDWESLRSEEHTSELQSLRHLVCRLLLRRSPRSTLFPYTTLFRSGSISLRLAPMAQCTTDLGTTADGLETGSRSDRKSTRLNSSHLGISYAVFCYGAHRDLHSFPTRRSSDLDRYLCGWLRWRNAPQTLGQRRMA